MKCNGRGGYQTGSGSSAVEEEHEAMHSQNQGDNTNLMPSWMLSHLHDQ